MRPVILRRFTVQFLKKLLQLVKERPGMFLKNQALWSEQNFFSAARRTGAREDLLPNPAFAAKHLAAKFRAGQPRGVKLPASATARK